MFRLKISSKLIIYFLGVSLLPLLVVTYFLVNNARSLLLKTAVTKQQIIATSTAYKVDNYIDDRIKALTLQSNLLSISAMNPETASKNFQVLLDQDEALKNISLLNSGGIQQVIVNDGGIDYEPVDQSKTDSYKAVSYLNGKSHVGSVSYDSQGNPSINISVPLIPKSIATNSIISSEQYLGFIVANYDISDLWESVLSTTIGEGGYAYVVDSLGNLVAHPDHDFLFKKEKLTNVEAVRNFISGNFETSQTKSETGQDVVSTPEKLQYSNWAVIVQEPEDSIYSGINSFLRLSEIIITVGVAFSIVISLIFRRQLLYPIRQLITGTTKISLGDFNYRVKVNTNDELRDLATTFNNMSQDISKLIKDLNLKNINLDNATKELGIANKQLQEADATKDDFISMASHQLSTPLTAVDGYLSLIDKGIYGQLSEKVTKTVKSALGRTQVMKGLLTDLLDVSRMTANRFFLDVSPTDLNKIVAEEVNELLPMAQQANVTLIYHPPESPIPPQNLDQQKTRQAAMNLITNAINYATGGKVDIFLSSDGEYATYNVVDNGIGVPDDQKAKLFNKFYRADNAKKHRPNGTGIGLYLVRRVIEDQGGKILFESEQGKGSMFGFKLPLNTGLQPGQQLASNPVDK